MGKDKVTYYRDMKFKFLTQLMVTTSYIDGKFIAINKLSVYHKISSC